MYCLKTRVPRVAYIPRNSQQVGLRNFQIGKFPFWKLPRTYWKFPSPFLEGLEVSSGREKVSIFTRVYCSNVYHGVDSYTVEYCRISRVLDLSGVYWRSVNTSSVIYDGNFLQIWKLSLGSFWKFLEVSKPKSRAWKFRSPSDGSLGYSS